MEFRVYKKCDECDGRGSREVITNNLTTAGRQWETIACIKCSGMGRIDTEYFIDTGNMFLPTDRQSGGKKEG